MKKRDFLKAAFVTTGALLLPEKMMALDYYPTTDKAEWAILYGTWCGTSRDASIWISEGMNGIANVFDVRENPDLSGYRYIVIGGSIRMGVTSKELQDYIKRNIEVLNGKIRGLFAVCGNMRQPITQERYDSFFDNHLFQLTGKLNVPLKVFPGRITWGLMESGIQEQMKSIPNMEEYDNLKRSECMDFGREILKSVG
jgi:menaquinone-dependent protoporphyrinogen IX oxidase